MSIVFGTGRGRSSCAKSRAKCASTPAHAIVATTHANAKRTFGASAAVNRRCQPLLTMYSHQEVRGTRAPSREHCLHDDAVCGAVIGGY